MTGIVLKSEIDVELIDAMGSDERIAHAAWVSTKGMASASPSDPAKVKGVLSFLMEKRHGTPFECGALTVRVHAPIKVWREWHRHRVGMCLAGDTPVDFQTPSTGDRNQRLMKDLFKTYKRPNTRSRLLRSPLRCIEAESRGLSLTQITDVMCSGEKRLYRVRSKQGGSIRASADHRFLTRDGWKRVSEFSNSEVLLQVRKLAREKPCVAVEPGFPEEWRPVLWNDFYEVSSHGRVRSYLIKGSHLRSRRPSPMLLTATVNRQGRLVVNIECQAVQISHLVAGAFLGQMAQGEQVLHIDDNPLNNSVINLYIGTAQNNADDRVRNGRAAANRVVEVPLLCVDKNDVEMTFDLSVAHDDHNFVANTFIIHNSYNEESGRYKQLDPVFWLPPRDRPMIRPEGFKSSRPAFDVPTEEEYVEITRHLHGGYSEEYSRYESLLAMQVDRGLARDVLGVGIFSACYVTLNPRSVMHFLELRTERDDARRPSKPLWEIAHAAGKLEAIFAERWPLTHELWNRHGRMAP